MEPVTEWVVVLIVLWAGVATLAGLRLRRQLEQSRPAAGESWPDTYELTQKLRDHEVLLRALKTEVSQVQKDTRTLGERIEQATANRALEAGERIGAASGVGLSAPSNYSSWTRSAPVTPVTGYARARANGIPVEFNGNEVVPSNALESLGLLVTSSVPGEKAELYLNENVELNNVAFDRWALLFDFQGGSAFSRFRTVQPSLIDWNASASRGGLHKRGVAEAMA